MKSLGSSRFVKHLYALQKKLRMKKGLKKKSKIELDSKKSVKKIFLSKS
jgi:hypothetical protein